jgi:hypothetical protein
MLSGSKTAEQAMLFALSADFAAMLIFYSVEFAERKA